MFATAMGTKLQTNVHGLTDAAKARILKDLKKGDQSRIAELVGTKPGYVKHVLRYRSGAKSVLSTRIWKAANRLLMDRERMQNDFGA